MADQCPKCGGLMVGDGYTSVRHCANVEDWDAIAEVDADAGPIYCEGTSSSHSPDYSAVVRAAREAIEAFKLGCFVDAGNALRSLDAALSASTPPDAGTCQCVGTRRYTDGTCDKCGNRIVTEEPK